MNKLLQNSKLQQLLFGLLFFLFLGAGNALGQVSTLANWSNVYNGILTSTQSITYTVPTGSDSNRVLVVAIASSTTTASTRTVTLTYGTQVFTASVGDMGSSTIQHTQIYYFNEAKLDAATNSTLSVRVQNGTTTMTDVWVTVLDNVDQSTLVTDSQNYNSGATNVDPIVFGTALSVNANDQAVEIIDIVRVGNTGQRTISSYATNWTSGDTEQTGTHNPGGSSNDQAIRTAVANRTIPVSNTTDVSSVNLSGSARASMTAISFKGCVPATANAGSALAAICQGGTSAGLGGSVGGAATSGTWTSSVAGGTFTPNATTLNATWTPPSAYSGTATLTLTTSGGGCGIASASKTLVVNPSPTAITAAASVSTICAGGSINLTATATSNSELATATLINENFNATPTGWTTTNTSTGGTPANAAWTLRTNGYNDGNETFNSNDASQFYLSNSDAQGSGGTTATTLQSPAFSTVGLSAASLTFYHYYRDYNTTDFAIVEVSTNGTSWTALETYTTTQGTRNSFAQKTINLNSYLDQATVSIRFRYAAVWSYYWAIDNVSVTGTLTTPPAPTYAWTSSSSGYTSSLQNPTVTPTATTIYTVTATNSYGCSASASTTVTVNTATAGTIGSAQAICSGGDPAAFTSTANGTGSGTISYRWESNTNLSTPSWSTVASQTSATYDVPSGLTVTTQYRRITISTLNTVACESAATASIQVTVNPFPTATITAGGVTTFCAGGSVTLTSSAGSSYLWSTGATTQSINATASGNYTVQVTNASGCQATSAVATVTVNPLPTAPVGTNGYVCGTGTATISATVAGGQTVDWYSAATAGTLLSSGTLSYSTPSIAATTIYYAEARTTSTGCVSTTRTAVTATVYAAFTAGAIATDGETICFGGSPSLAVGSSANATGNGTITYKWQANGVDIADTNTATFDPPANLTVTTTYTRFAKDATCATSFTASSGSWTVTVTPATVGGAVTGGTSICSGYSSGLLTLSGNTGNVVRWERSVSPFATWTSISNTATTYAPVVLTETTQFRAVVQNGVCSQEFSTPTTVAIETTTWKLLLPANVLGWDNGYPNSATKAAVISANYTSTGDITACSLTVNTNAIVVIAATHNVTLTGALTVSTGSFTLNNNANLIQSGTTNNNSGNIFVKRSTSVLKRLDYVMWSSPVANTNFKLQTFSPSTVASRFYEFLSATNAYAVVNAAATNFNVGQGYLIRLPNNHSTAGAAWTGTYNGVPNNGDINLSVLNNSFVALGNPYPSTIDADQFMDDNGINQLYFWRKRNNELQTTFPTTSYATYTLAGGAANPDPATVASGSIEPNGIIQVGQGFIVKSTSTDISFNNGQRVVNTQNQFLRNAATTPVERHRIWLNMTNNTDTANQMMVAYMTGATQGFDAKIDGRYFNDGQTALTSLIDGAEYSIQGRSLPFDNADTVSLGFKAAIAGTYTISIDHVDGLFLDANQNIYLRDNLTGIVQNLKAGSHTFVTATGTFNTRFEIIYQYQALNVNQQQFDANQVVIYNNNSDLVINSGTTIMSSVKVFDIRGRLIVENKNINSAETRIQAGQSNEVLLVQITSQDGVVVTKKAIR